MRWFLIILLMGCTRHVYTPLVSRHTVIDTIVSQASDSAMLRALFECDSLGNVMVRELHQVKGKMAKQSLDFADNELRVQTRWQTRIVDRIVELRDTITVVELREIEIAKPYIPAFFWWALGVAALSCIWWGIKLF